MKNSVTISTSEKLTITINDRRGNPIGKYVVDPGDPSVIRRYLEVVRRFDDFSTRLTKMNSTDLNSVDAVEKIEIEIEDMFNYLLDYDASADLFSNKKALSTNEKGEMYFVQLFAAISSTLTAANKNTEKKRRKHRRK